MRLKYLLPLAVFLGLVVLLAVGLNLNPTVVPSPLVGKPAPAFELPRLADPDSRLSSGSLKGQVWLLNVWASWCISCRQEHPVLMDLAARRLVPIYGLNYKDRREDALRWLAEHGNPYVASGHDLDGRVGMDYGVYGVPETYVIDREGIIRYKHIGPLTPQDVQEKILPLVRSLQG